MSTDFRALCAELTDCLEKADWPLRHRYVFRQWIDIARAALADEPAVPQSKEPASVTRQPSDEELLDLLPQGNESGFWLPKGLPSDWVDGEFIAPPKAIIAFARDVLELWGNPTPQPSADGEVVEVVERLRTVVAAYKSCRNTDHIWSLSGNGVNARLTVTLLTRAAELLQRQAPQPPADGEVAELAAEIRHFLAGYQQMRGLDPEHIYSIHRGDKMEAHITVSRLTRAAELLERQVPVAVSERLPRPSVKVLAHYFNGLGKERTICAIWVPAKTRSDSYGDDDFTEYDEESDTFYWPEGWYETIENWDDLGYVKVDEGEVIYWQPIPKLPAHALPLPEVGA